MLVTRTLATHARSAGLVRRYLLHSQDGERSIVLVESVFHGSQGDWRIKIVVVGIRVRDVCDGRRRDRISWQTLVDMLAIRLWVCHASGVVDTGDRDPFDLSGIGVLDVADVIA